MTKESKMYLWPIIFLKFKKRERVKNQAKVGIWDKKVVLLGT